MATLRDIKSRITGVRSTSKITQAMRMVAAAKLKRSQDSIISARPYIEKLGAVMADLVESVGEGYWHPLLERRKEVKGIAVIVVTSDRGMCGGFNSGLLRFAVQKMKSELPEEYPGAAISVIPVGKKACAMFQKEHASIAGQFSGVFDNLRFETVKDIMEIAEFGFFDGRFDRVFVVYNRFKNLLTQIPSIQQLLPVEKIAEGGKKSQSDYIFEPGRKAILDELLPKNLEIQMWRALLESNAAEQAARMMAMENATRNANELIRDLELLYNKARQASITTEMLEIVGGAEALKKS